MHLVEELMACQVNHALRLFTSHAEEVVEEGLQ
jgi:hypothetical protein